MFASMTWHDWPICPFGAGVVVRSWLPSIIESSDGAGPLPSPTSRHRVTGVSEEVRS
jgi:hypothetical protein